MICYFDLLISFTPFGKTYPTVALKGLPIMGPAPGYGIGPDSSQPMPSLAFSVQMLGETLLLGLLHWQDMRRANTSAELRDGEKEFGYYASPWIQPHLRLDLPSKLCEPIDCLSLLLIWRIQQPPQNPKVHRGTL